jgi:hypothetical protein
MQAKTLPLSSIKNIQFTKLLKAQGSLKEFNFRKTAVDGKIIFNVDVTDERGNRIIFAMEKQNDNWKIQPSQLPSWITEGEKQLDQLIAEEWR